MRMFVAVDLDEAARALAARAAAELARRIEKRGERARITWVSRENMHLTIRFLAHVEDQATAALLEAFRAPIAVPPFEAELSGLGVFPEQGPPRVIWMGVTEGLTGLRGVHAEVAHRLGAAGVTPEDRPFSPHLTLGRVKEAGGAAARILREAIVAGLPGSARWRVDHVSLYESRLSSEGPRYVVQAQASLGIGS